MITLWIFVGSVLAYIVGVGVRNEMLPKRSSYRLENLDNDPLNGALTLFWPVEIPLRIMLWSAKWPFRMGTRLMQRSHYRGLPAARIHKE